MVLSSLHVGAYWICECRAYWTPYIESSICDIGEIKPLLITAVPPISDFHGNANIPSENSIDLILSRLCRYKKSTLHVTGKSCFQLNETFLFDLLLF